MGKTVERRPVVQQQPSTQEKQTQEVDEAYREYVVSLAARTAAIKAGQEAWERFVS